MMTPPILTEVVVPLPVETAISPDWPYVTTTPLIVISAPPLDSVVPSITAFPGNSVTLRGVEPVVVIKADERGVLAATVTRPDGPKLITWLLIVVAKPP